MIIRHDLKLIFLHVPKCAGKQLRDVWLQGADPDTTDDFFNFQYSARLHRYLDLAHLTMDDLVHFDAAQCLASYTVIAAIRHPYLRLRSAVNEYYRQYSVDDETIVNGRGPSPSMSLRYMEQLPMGHSARDPRFVHSFPITWFTHYGNAPKVDYLLRCDTLRDDAIELAQRLNLPAAIIECASCKLQNQPDESDAWSHARLTPGEQEMAHRLYAQDFHTFGFTMKDPASFLQDPLFNVLSQLDPADHHSHGIDQLWRAQEVHWHWGPQCQRQEPVKLDPVRIRSRS